MFIHCFILLYSAFTKWGRVAKSQYIFARTFSDTMVILEQHISGMQLEVGGGAGLPSPFSKIGKKFPNLEKNALIVVIYGHNFSFEMKFLRVSRRKRTEIFTCGAFLCHVVDECLSKCPNSKKTTLP